MQILYAGFVHELYCKYMYIIFKSTLSQFGKIHDALQDRRTQQTITENDDGIRKTTRASTAVLPLFTAMSSLIAKA